MATRDWTKLFISASALLWLGLIIAPVIVVADELQEIEHPAIDFLFTSGNRANGFDEVYLEPVSVWYPNTSHRGEDAANDLRQLAIDYVEAALGARGLVLVDEPTARGLTVRIQYIDLTAAPVSRATLEWARQFRFRVEPGRITIVAEVRDSATDNILLRMADLQEEDLQNNVANIELALQHWTDVLVANLAWPSADAQLARVAGD